MPWTAGYGSDADAKLIRRLTPVISHGIRHVVHGVSDATHDGGDRHESDDEPAREGTRAARKHQGSDGADNDRHRKPAESLEAPSGPGPRVRSP